MKVIFVHNSSSEALQQSLLAISVLVLVGLVVTVPTAGLLVPDRSIANHRGSDLKGIWQLLSRPSPFRRLLLAFLLSLLGTAFNHKR